MIDPATLRPAVRRYRNAEAELDEAERLTSAARAEFAAARQELIDAIETACKEIR